jgi:ribosomal protein L25 (general stress protein Ctc)
MTIELMAEPRAELGKEKCHKLRAANKLPGNIYGGPLPEARPINLDLHATELLVKRNGKHADYTVTLEGVTYAVRLEEVRYDPLSHGFQHLDFVVRADE